MCGGRYVQLSMVAFASVLVLGGTAPMVSADILLVPDQYPTIQAAVDAANPAGGDTIVVGPGEFAGAVITNPVKIVGAGDDTRITSGNFLYSQVAFALFGHFFEIDGTEISSLLVEYEGLAYGFTVFYADDVTITNITINESVLGIDGRWADRLTVNHVQSNDTAYPISAYYSNGVTANGNTLTNSCRGIEARYSDGCTFNHNSVIGLVPFAGWGGTVQHCDGIVVGETTNCVAAHNYVWHVGIAVGGFDEEMYVGMAMGSFGGPHESNNFHHNQIEVQVPDADWSGSIVLVDYGVLWYGQPVSVKNNQVMHNDLCGSTDGVAYNPEQLEDFNKSKFNQCDE